MTNGRACTIVPATPLLAGSALGEVALATAAAAVEALTALIILIGFWGPFYCNYNRVPENSIGNYSGPYITLQKSVGLY